MGEELVLAGIASIVGKEVPCIGGSAADLGDLDGKWWVMVSSPGDGSISHVGGADGVAVTMMWPSVQTEMVFSSCYTPTAARGTITKCERREVIEIDGLRAADVYGGWTQRHRADSGALWDATLAPLARRVGGTVSDPSLLLIHPQSVTERGGLTTFADVKLGEELLCMSGTRSDLVNLMLEATADPGIADFCTSLQGALAIYCAGCSLAVGNDRLPAVARNLSNTLGGKPFTVMLTYGEQGVDSDGINGHGNLMYSLLLFGAPKPTAPIVQPSRSDSSEEYGFGDLVLYDKSAL